MPDDTRSEVARSAPGPQGPNQAQGGPPAPGPPAPKESRASRRRHRGPAPPPPPAWRKLLIPAGVFITTLLLVDSLLGNIRVDRIDYSTFLDRIEAGEVASVQIDTQGAVEGTTADTGDTFKSQVPTALENGELTELLREEGVRIEAVGPRLSIIEILIGFSPLLLMLALFVYLGRRAQAGGFGGLFNLGRSKATVIDTERPETRFDDVAGYAAVKQEIHEVVDYLKAPERYSRAGAYGPRGVLMVGPPGTGKTLLARAVAGEAHVPFLSVSGSSFVEMFVGVGAARIRDLFNDARKRAPAIIFIDEIDAVGQKRGGQINSNDEREQTLNQLLAEMDGFDVGSGVVVLAATNRPETLDAALLRPGRFDRQVVVPLPNQSDRAAILAVHVRDKQLGPDVDIETLARATPGFAGADLANLVNEAAIHAVRGGREVLGAMDFEDARERIVLGRRETSTVLLPSEKRSIAFHEAGHALVAVHSANADPVAKVTILPAGMSLGATHQQPLDERHLYTEGYMRDSLAVRLGGRAAELLVFGEASTGAANDLLLATRLATRMVREYGLSPRVGPVGYGSDSPMYLGTEEVHSRHYSEVTQRVIDEEVARLVSEAETVAVELLRDRREELDKVAAMLLDAETIDGEAVYAIAGKAAPTREKGMGVD